MSSFQPELKNIHAKSKRIMQSNLFEQGRVPQKLFLYFETEMLLPWISNPCWMLIVLYPFRQLYQTIVLFDSTMLKAYPVSLATVNLISRTLVCIMQRKYCLRSPNKFWNVKNKVHLQYIITYARKGKILHWCFLQK